MAGEILYIKSDQHEDVKGRARDSEIGEIPNRRAKHDTDPTKEACSSAPEWTKYEGRWCDLIGQFECGLEVFIGWEPCESTHL